jgi:outer membrane lipoprotein-sorting protein
MKLSHFISALIFLQTCCFAYPGEALPDQQVADLLAQIAQANPATVGRKAAFRETRTSPLFAKPDVAEGTLYFVPPNRIRKDVIGSHASSIRSDGQYLWMIYPTFQEAERYRLSAAPGLGRVVEGLRAVLDFSNPRKNFHVRVERLEDGFALELTPRGALKRDVRKITARLGSDLRAKEVILDFADSGCIRLEILSEEPFTASNDFFQFTPSRNYRVSYPLGE